MTLYDPLRTDSYAEHLVEVNQVNQVIASDDIVNDQGLLLIKKGQPISRQQVDRIVNFKLVRPLESSIDILDALTLEKLQKTVQGLLIDSSMQVLHAKHNLTGEFKKRAETLFRFPILIQKLTVLSIQRPHDYQKAVLLAWFSLIIAAHLGLPENERDHLFIVALVHDIGMLHIPREILGKKGDLTHEEWRAIQSHVVIGQKILQRMKGLPESVATAVLEHHEMCDGTGYPAGRFGRDLNLSGQIVCLLDHLYAIYAKKLLPKGRSLRDILPIVQINGYVYRQDICNIVLRIFREQPPSESSTLDSENIGEFTASFLRDRLFLNSYFERINLIVKQLPLKEHRLVRAVRAVEGHLNKLVSGSGVLSEGYGRWSEQVAEERITHAYREMEDTYLMSQEVGWQLLKITRLLHTIADDENIANGQERAALKTALEGLPSLAAWAGK